MATRPLICLITPGHLASAPRVLKEADALVGDGYDVHVISGGHFAPLDSADTQIRAGAPWRSTRVELNQSRGRLARKVFRTAARLLLTENPSGGVAIATRALSGGVRELSAAAVASGADFFLGHGLPGLAAAAAAAQATETAYGFDAEDFHAEETPHAIYNPAERTIIRTLEQKLLPGCRHLTAASPLIAAAYQDRYGVHPTSVRNVFPLALAPALPVPVSVIDAQHPAKLYWFSQTIGAGRGLETMLQVISYMKTPAELHLRGFSSDEYRQSLRQRATRLGVESALHWLEPAVPGDMVRLAAGFHLGLSLEEATPRNRDLCLTNKVFTYILAGIPQLLSPTQAQRELAPALRDAALLAPTSDAEGTARMLDIFFADPGRVDRARAASWSLGHKVYNWDTEKSAFLDSLRRVGVAARPR